ncbi:hypothetical protein ABPG75_004372 [Micractinium tetrahymenae]
MTRKVQMQKGLHIRAEGHTISEVPIACPPADHNQIQPQAYAALLKAADPQHLLVAEVPISELLGRRMVLVYDASSQGPPNTIASRLTTGMEDGLSVEIRGDAVCFYARPHADLCQADWQALDNAIYGELCEFFQQGAKPTAADLQALVENFKAGRFDYSKHREGEEGEDVNKDDAGEDLQDALAEP